MHAGGALTVRTIDRDGALTTIRVGADHAPGDRLQAMVPAGTWFGGELAPEAEWALVGCAVAPGFDFADFELGRRAELVAAYPHHRAVIERLTTA